ncbi:CDP-alcohol phosphatidyltransferase family protein [Pedobacter sp. GR22-6]|uniref:CDP-alcohol phosphatidyltransferase family protein n=1 Tax=Pedobacter sp. GR22-6 TaxID=3127957 RepID=UPI00307F6BED
MKKQIPIALIYSRLVFAALIILLAIQQPAHYRLLINVLLVTGLLTDVFDGIIARSLKISTVKLRRLDSIVDQVFWISALVAAYLICSTFFKEHAILLFLLLAAEAMTYGVSYIKFKKEVATHAVSSKFWTLLILATLIQIISSCDSSWLFMTCFYVGMVTRMEIMAILLLLSQWENDIPSVFHAIRIRQGKKIKRNKLFNG